MSITDELREWAHGFNGPWKRNEVALLAIADRIDAAVGGMVKLPKDVDGVPIRVGDELDGLHYEDGTVTGIQYGTNGRTMIAVRPNGWDTSTWRDPEEYCHRIADTWERIIEDAANLVRADNKSVVELVERCRRLAGEV